MKTGEVILCTTSYITLRGKPKAGFYSPPLLPLQFSWSSWADKLPLALAAIIKCTIVLANGLFYLLLDWFFSSGPASCIPRPALLVLDPTLETFYFQHNITRTVSQLSMPFQCLHFECISDMSCRVQATLLILPTSRMIYCCISLFYLECIIQPDKAQAS